MPSKPFNMPLILLTACLVPLAAAAQPDMRSTSQLLEELTISFNVAREAENALKANLAQKNAYRQEQEAANRENAGYKSESSEYARDLSRHNDEVDSFNAECGSGNFSREELARCDAREAQMKTAGAALETRRMALEEKRLAVKALTDAYNQKERERAQAAEALLTRYDDANATIEALIARLTSDQQFSHCADRPSPEAAQQCILLAYRGRR